LGGTGVLCFILILRALASFFSSFFALSSSTVLKGSGNVSSLSLSLSSEGAPGGPFGGGGIAAGGLEAGGGPLGVGRVGAGAGAGAGGAGASPLASANDFFISSVLSVILLLKDLFVLDGNERLPLLIEALTIFGFSSTPSLSPLSGFSAGTESTGAESSTGAAAGTAGGTLSAPLVLASAASAISFSPSPLDILFCRLSRRAIASGVNLLAGGGVGGGATARFFLS
jgi:hypothetical protein